MRDAVQTNVQGPQRAAEALKVAGVWEGVSAAIAAGTVRGMSSILSAVMTANQTALGTDGMLRWKAFGTVLGAKLKELYDTGTLKTSEDWATLIDEGAQGLRAVK
ncbi:hypothetical protein VT03_13480 [Planctomyces sp. SH-PL14]|nr:hypothetical protein VT03_13480 [Planctomyces sp. SH-PL14]